MLLKVANHIDVLSGKWTAQDAGIGAGVDSYFEYLLKGGILFGLPKLVDMFKGIITMGVRGLNYEVELLETVLRLNQTILSEICYQG